MTTGVIDVYPSVTDVSTTSTVPTARVGQTVTVAHTVRNLGPVLEPWVTVQFSGGQPGAQFVGAEGCTFTATTFDCRIDNLAAGQTAVVKVMVKVNSCPPRRDGVSENGAPYSNAALPDPNGSNENLRMAIIVKGC